ncbi:hypothetical protein V8C86DRAFT_3142613 [Haematococcus lacustris]
MLKAAQKQARRLVKDAVHMMRHEARCAEREARAEARVERHATREAVRKVERDQRALMRLRAEEVVESARLARAQLRLLDALRAQLQRQAMAPSGGASCLGTGDSRGEIIAEEQRATVRGISAAPGGDEAGNELHPAVGRAAEQLQSDHAGSPTALDAVLDRLQRNAMARTANPPSHPSLQQCTQTSQAGVHTLSPSRRSSLASGRVLRSSMTDGHQAGLGSQRPAAPALVSSSNRSQRRSSQAGCGLSVASPARQPRVSAGMAGSPPPPLLPLSPPLLQLAPPPPPLDPGWEGLGLMEALPDFVSSTTSQHPSSGFASGQELLQHLLFQGSQLATSSSGTDDDSSDALSDDTSSDTTTSSSNSSDDLSSSDWSSSEFSETTSSSSASDGSGSDRAARRRSRAQLALAAAAHAAAAGPVIRSHRPSAEQFCISASETEARHPTEGGESNIDRDKEAPCFATHVPVVSTSRPVDKAIRAAEAMLDRGLYFNLATGRPAPPPPSLPSPGLEAGQGGQQGDAWCCDDMSKGSSKGSSRPRTPAERSGAGSAGLSTAVSPAAVTSRPGSSPEQPGSGFASGQELLQHLLFQGSQLVGQLAGQGGAAGVQQVMEARLQVMVEARMDTARQALTSVII